MKESQCPEHYQHIKKNWDYFCIHRRSIAHCVSAEIVIKTRYAWDYLYFVSLKHLNVVLSDALQILCINATYADINEKKVPLFVYIITEKRSVLFCRTSLRYS